MTSSESIPTLASLDFHPYLTETGHIREIFQGQLGVYAIFDAAQVLQFVGFSRDLSLSLKQHLVRCPHQCHWVKTYTITKPSRTLMEQYRDAWIQENGILPPGNGSDENRWTQPIDAKVEMTPDEHSAYAQSDEPGKTKVLKQVARRVEAEILAVLEQRGVQMPLRFDPKLKEDGLLTLKSVS